MIPLESLDPKSPKYQLLQAHFHPSMGKIYLEQTYLSGYRPTAKKIYRVYSFGHRNYLSMIMKIDQASMISREWQVFCEYVPSQYTGITPVIDKPVYTSDGKWGAIFYPLVGGKGFEVESLLDYWKEANTTRLIDDVITDELFQNLQHFWAVGEFIEDYSLQDNYGHLLPYLLRVKEEPNVSIQAKNVKELDLTDDVKSQDFEIGQKVRIIGAEVNSISTHSDLVTLRPVGKEFHSNRIQVSSERLANEYTVDQYVAPFIATIKRTRHKDIEEKIQKFLPSYQVVDTHFSTPDLRQKLNPLYILDDILKLNLTVRYSGIHGDLNLKNILVEHYEDQQVENHIAHLIDFDRTRRDHILRDLLRFETEILAHCVARICRDEGVPFSWIYDFYNNLHKACSGQMVIFDSDFKLEKEFRVLVEVRKLAKYYLVDRNSWYEYYVCLYLYMIGNLKFSTMSPYQLAASFWASVALVELFDWNKKYR